MNISKKFTVITGDFQPNEIDTGIHPVTALDAIHPSRQLNLILDSIKEASEPVIWAINSDTTISHINNLILLGEKKDYNLSLEQGYNGLFIEPKDINVFEFTENKELVELELGEYGYIVPWISKHLEELFDKVITIQNTLKGDIE